MNNKDFTTTILIDRSPKEAFDAINNVRGWWSENIKGDTNKLNDEYTYEAEGLHVCKMKLVEVIPGEKVVWEVMDNHFTFTKDQNEWKGTKVVFEISKQGEQTQIRFTHVGLVPGQECYDICNNAWTGYIQNSLRDLITLGKGQPNKIGS